MRKALIITLVIVVLVTGLPILVGGMSMGSCRDCGAASIASSACSAAVVVAFSLFVVMLVDVLRPRRVLCHLELIYASLDRPPRLV